MNTGAVVLARVLGQRLCLPGDSHLSLRRWKWEHLIESCRRRWRCSRRSNQDSLNHNYSSITNKVPRPIIFLVKTYILRPKCFHMPATTEAINSKKNRKTISMSLISRIATMTLSIH